VSDTYRDVGYASCEIGAGRRPAILVVDLQVAFTDPKYPLGNLPMIHAATGRTAALLPLARSKQVPVAACYTAYCSLADMPLWKLKAVRDEFYYGHPCTEIDARIHHADNFTYCKNAPSMFFQTPLITFLVKHSVDTVIVTGCTTSGCVRATIIDAFSYGFRVLVPQDCVGDADETQHRSNLADVGRRYADITDSASIRQYLERLPASR
jgi:maleamate amidohydrolase